MAVCVLQHLTDFEDVAMNARFNTVQWFLLTDQVHLLGDPISYSCFMESLKRREAVILHCQLAG